MLALLTLTIVGGEGQIAGQNDRSGEINLNRLLDASRSSDPHVRKKALLRIRREIVPDQIHELHDELAPSRERAAILLGAIGPAAADAVAALRLALRDPNVRVRREAAYALGSIGSPAKVAVPSLLRALNDRDSLMRVWVSFSLWRIDKKMRKRSIPVLIDSLRDRDIAVGRSAAIVLAEMREDAAESLPHLVHGLKHRTTDDYTKVRFAVAVWQIEKKPDVVVPELVNILSKGSRPDKLEAIIALKIIGPAAKTAIPSLMESLKDRTLEMQAREALRRIEPE